MTMLTAGKTLLITTALAAVAAGAPLQAAAAPRDAAANGTATSSDDEDIVVTAQKREQTLINVPLSVSVVSGATLERQQAFRFEDYLKLVPGLQLNQDTPGEGRLVIRGINTGGVASTVAVYVDETPFGSSSGLVNGATLAGDFDTFDVARVEVLRGPQGTLYGASSLGGVLKFVTNAPETDKLVVRGHAGIEAVKGGDVSYYGQAVVNVPLTSTLAVRGTGYYRKDGGFIDSIGTAGSNLHNNIDGAKTYGGRASLLFTPNDQLSVRLSAMLQNIEVKAPSIVESDPATLGTLYGRPSQSEFVPQFSNIRYRVYNGTVNFDLGFATLTSSSSYATQNLAFRSDATTDLSGLIAAIFKVPNQLYLAQQTNDKKYTQEVRLASKSSSVFEWLVGGYYTHEDGLIRQRYVPVTPGTLTEILPPALPLLANVSLASTYEEEAGFANGTLHLGSRLDIDFGGRYSHNNQHAQQINDGVLVGGPATLPVARSSENVFTYSAGPKFKLNDHASIYARVAKGFRPGGPNVLPPPVPGVVTPPPPATYHSDTVISYEGGIKVETADHSFGIDVSAFHIDWNNIQLLAVVNNFGVNTNAGRAVSDGAEFTMTVRPTGGFDISVNGAFTNARLKTDTDPIVGGLAGDQLPYTPKYSVGVNGDYRWSLGTQTAAFTGASLRFLSNQSGSFDPNYKTAVGHGVRVPSYQVIDLRAGVEFGKFTVQAYAKNINDAMGRTSNSPLKANGSFNYPNGALGTGVIRPRTIGLALTAAY